MDYAAGRQEFIVYHLLLSEKWKDTINLFLKEGLDLELSQVSKIWRRTDCDGMKAGEVSTS